MLPTPGSAPIDFHVRPGGAYVYDADELIAQAPLEIESTYQFEADTGRTHRLRIQRAPFDTVVLDVRWVDGRWKTSLFGQDVWLAGGRRIDLNRTIHLQVVPSDAQVFEEVASGTQTLTLRGEPHAVAPLLVSGDGYVIPHAWQPPLLFFTKPGFQMATLQLAEAQLDNPIMTFPDAPVQLAPTYGPFSYRWFDATLGVAGLGAIGWWSLVMRPKRSADRAVALRLHQALAAVDVKARGWDNLVGQVLDTSTGARYLLTRLLGRGGMGAVYVGETLNGQDSVAIKLLRIQHTADAEARFQREIKVCSSLSHPGIVQVLDWGHLPLVRGTAAFVVMELVRGVPMSERMKGPIAEHQVVSWAADLLRALKVAHAAGIVHRDLKPDNIMILDNDRVKLIDFGIAHVLGERMTGSREVIGTWKYMSPEQFGTDPIGPASDLYSLGVVLYELTTGVRPFMDDDPFAYMYHVIEDDAPDPLTLNPRLNVALALILHRLVNRELNVRYVSADQVLADLERLG